MEDLTIIAFTNQLNFSKWCSWFRSPAILRYATAPFITLCQLYYQMENELLLLTGSSNTLEIIIGVAVAVFVVAVIVAIASVLKFCVR